MTRPDLDERQEEQMIHRQTVGQAVVEVVKQGLQDDRVTCGADKCVDLLGSSPDDIMFCFMAKPTSGQDAAINIKHVLLRAYCQENEIDYLTIEDGQSKMKELLQSCQEPSPKEAAREPASPKQPVAAESGGLKLPTAVSTAFQEEGDITSSLFDGAIGGHLMSRKGFVFKLPVDESSESERCEVVSSLKGSTVEPVGDCDIMEPPPQTHDACQWSEKPEKEVDKQTAGDTVDYGCVMVKYPQHTKSQEDELVADFVHQELRMYVQPCVELPEMHKVTPVQDQLPLPKQKEPPEEDGMTGKVMKLPLSHAVTASPPPDIGHWTMVKLKKNFKPK